MFKKTMALMITFFLILACVSAATASGSGLFGELSRYEDADERLVLLEEVAEPVSVSAAADPFSVEISQAYYEGNRIFVAYRASGAGINIQDGLDLPDGTYADIIAGDAFEQEDGSLIGWKECIVPDGQIADPQTFTLVFGQSYENRLSFTMNHRDYEQSMQGTSATETWQAQARIFVGKVDMKANVRLLSPEQAASWKAWQEDGEEDTDVDAIGCWYLYRNGKPVSIDLLGEFTANDADEVVFEMVFPRMEDLSGLSLVPEYSESGEKPGEAIALEPVA